MRTQKTSLFINKVIIAFFAILMLICKKYTFISEYNNKIIFIVLSILIVWKIDYTYTCYIKKKAFWGTSIIVSFLFFGYDFAVVFKYHNHFVSALIFLLSFFWSGGMVYFISVLSSHVSELLNAKEQHVKEKYKVSILLFGIVFLAGIFSLIVFFPGVITPDNIYFWNANIYNETDIHSYAYLLFVQIIKRIFNSYSALVIILVSLFSLVWALIGGYLYKKGLDKRLLFIITFIWVILPGNFYMLSASWKDIPYTICLLLLTYQFMRIEEGDWYGYDFVLLILGLCGTAVFRSNGQVVFFISIIVIVIGFIRRRVPAKALIATILAIAAFAIFKGPVFDYFGVKQSPSNYSALPFMDGIVEYIYQGNKLDDITAKYVYSLTNDEDIMKHYLPGHFDISMFLGGYTQFDIHKAFDGWLRCLLQHPICTLASRFKKTFNFWSVFVNSRFPVDKFYYVDNAWAQEIGYTNIRFRELRILIQKVYCGQSLLTYMVDLLSRGGIWLVVWISSLYYMNDKRKAITMIPVLANSFAMFLGCCFLDYRYIYPMFVIGVIYYLFSIAPDKNQS